MENLGQLSVARMVDLPFRLLRPKFLQLWVPATAMALVAQSPWTLASVTGAAATGSDGLPSLAAMGAWLVAGPISFVAYAVMTGVIYGAVIDFMDGRPIDFLRSFRSLDLSRLAVIAILFVVSLAGFFCCFIPGIVVSTYLDLATPVAFVEGKTPGNAFQRSLDLVRGSRVDWWSDVTARALAVVIVTILFQYALGSLVTLPQTFLIMKASFESAASGVPMVNAYDVVPWWITVPTAFGSACVMALSFLYQTTGSLLVYRYARERLEGTGLETAIQDAQKP